MSSPANSLNITSAGIVKFDGTSVFSPVTVSQYNTLVGGSSNSITSVLPGTSGYVLTSNGGSADPSYQAISNSSLPGSGQITLNNGTNISVSGSPVALGAGATINVSGPPSATTLTSNGVVYGQGTSAIAATAAGTDNTVLLGHTGLAPTFGSVPNAALSNSSITLNNGANITVTGSPVSLGGAATVAVSGTTNHAIQLGNASGSLTSASLLTNGQILIGSTGSDPVAANITAGTGISINNTAGGITISSTATGFVWNEVTGTSSSMAVANGYVANNVALVTLTLPATAAFGDVIKVAGKGAGLFKVGQNASQTIHFESSDTTTGTGGSLTSLNQYCALELLCITANTDFEVLSSVGSFTVV